MAQVSRNSLNKKTQERIHSLFITAISLAKSKNEIFELIDDLFTPTERIVLAKRFSIAYMLCLGYDYSTIKSILHVSGSTIGHVSYWLKTKGKGVRLIIDKIKADESWRKELKDIGINLLEIFTSNKMVRRNRVVGLKKPF